MGSLWHIVGAAGTWRVRAETGQDPVKVSWPSFAVSARKALLEYTVVSR